MSFASCWRGFIALCVVLGAVGCERSLKPGDQIYALKNPTREWKIPERDAAVESIEAAQEEEAKKEVAAVESEEEQVEPSIYVDPPILLAERMRPDQPYETAVMVTSKEWESFELENLSSDLEGLEWEVEPADEKDLGTLQALSGWILTAKLPAGLPDGQKFEHAVYLKAKATDGSEESRTFEIPVLGKVLRRLAVYGESVDASGTVSFGVLPRGLAHRRKLVVKVHDEESALELVDFVAQPDFIDVKFTPVGKGETTKNLYQLEVVLPANAPEHVARKSQLGSLQLMFEHPRIKRLDLDVDFVIHGRATSWSMVHVN